MRGVLAIYEKEMRHYFRSPIAYFVMAVFLTGAGYFFTYNLFRTEWASMAETFQSMGVLLLLVLPAVSMRLFSGEWSEGTMELLGTLPLAPWQVVLGKFLGAVSLLVLMTLGTLIDLIPLYAFAEPETHTLISGYLGFVLLGMACLALGQLFSAFTENQIVAALVTVSVLLAFWFVGHLKAFQNEAWAYHLLSYLSFSYHFGQFVSGLVRSESVIYYLVVCAIALTLNAGYLSWRR